MSFTVPKKTYTHIHTHSYTNIRAHVLFCRFACYPWVKYLFFSLSFVEVCTTSTNVKNSRRHRSHLKRQDKWVQITMLIHYTVWIRSRHVSESRRKTTRNSNDRIKRFRPWTQELNRHISRLEAFSQLAKCVHISISPFGRHTPRQTRVRTQTCDTQ